MYGMVKTTLYLSPELKANIERVARAERRSEAEVIREALDQGLALRSRPRPRFGLFDSGDPEWAAAADSDMDGFGE
jgi:predicted transcriptional regulator